MRRRTAHCRDTLAHFSLPNTEDAVSQYHDINNALWAALEQGKVRQDKLVIQRFEKLLAAFGVQAIPWRSTIIT